jgi:outer membrane protein insertion porin family
LPGARALFVVTVLCAAVQCWGQTAQSQTPVEAQAADANSSAVPDAKAPVPGLRAWEGLKIASVDFRGVSRETLDPLPRLLPLRQGMPLEGVKMRESLRRLYSTGLYRTIEVEGTRTGDEVTIIFTGEPRMFLGRIAVEGVQDDKLSSQIVRASKLNPGTPFSQNKVEQGEDLIEQFLKENGYYRSTIFYDSTTDAANSLVNVNYKVALGPNARVGEVKVDGDAGISMETFRKKSKLKANSKVNRDTASRALTNLRKVYQKQERLEADVSLKSKEYRLAANHLDYAFGVDRGPIVTIEVDGVKLSKGNLRRLIPVYEEGAVDEDLLNEGDRNLRDYFQREGYFDVKITHARPVHTAERSDILYSVVRGLRHRVASVSVKGNKYFSADTIAERLSVQKADVFQRSGLYSAALVSSDVDSISALYQSNGFNNVKVTSLVGDYNSAEAGKAVKVGSIAVTYTIDEGVQQRVGKFDVLGADKVPLSTLKPLLNTEVGQPYSVSNVLGDRDEVLGYYLDHGFDQAEVNVTQRPDPSNAALVDITMTITEGDEIFVRQVLVSGLHYTRPKTVSDLLTVHAGDPLNEAALLNTQRRLYDLALFNEVNTVVQNPNGVELRKNVLLQLTEARRWDLNYGAGFEAQTGNPSTNCLNATTLIELGINPASYVCSPNGKTGVSGAVLFDVTRTNVRGTNQSITLRTAYGSLEQRATLSYQIPHPLGLKKFQASLTGGYINAQDVTTYASSRLEGSLRITEKPDRRNTFIYEFVYRRVKVESNSIQIAPDLIPLYSRPVRVGGPAFTWVRDTRDNPIDAHRGTYTSFNDFVAESIFGSEANFNRVDVTNSSYYAVGKRKWVIARSTRYGQERSFGDPSQETIPLPERLYAGGAQSHRGFPINQAGPRDELTGFPIGGAGVFVNSLELRLPNPTLPYVGDSVGFVLFHDMGNVFNSSSEIWPSFLRFHQPNVATCKDLSVIPVETGELSSGKCSFNYFSHAVGIGVRYHTPIGPLRGDFAVNLDPPIYPVFVTYSSGSNPVAVPAHVGQAGHFNFFFSIGQSF